MLTLHNTYYSDAVKPRIVFRLVLRAYILMTFLTRCLFKEYSDCGRFEVFTSYNKTAFSKYELVQYLLFYHIKNYEHSQTFQALYYQLQMIIYTRNYMLLKNLINPNSLKH
jgi:hypothetical protein